MSDRLRATPGPWIADHRMESGDFALFEGGNGCAIESFFEGGLTHPDDDVNRANGRLIAAAPVLYDALENLLEGFPFPTTGNEYELVQSGCDPTEARKIARAVSALETARCGQ